MTNEWNKTSYTPIVKLSFEKKIPDQIIRGLFTNISFEVAQKDSDYYIGIRNGDNAAYVALTREEFNHIAQEIYKLWEPTNIVEALNKLK